MKKIGSVQDWFTRHAPVFQVKTGESVVPTSSLDFLIYAVDAIPGASYVRPRERTPAQWRELYPQMLQLFVGELLAFRAPLLYMMDVRADLWSASVGDYRVQLAEILSKLMDRAAPPSNAEALRLMEAIAKGERPSGHSFVFPLPIHVRAGERVRAAVDPELVDEVVTVEFSGFSSRQLL